MLMALLILSAISVAGFVHGDIYRSDLQPLNRTVIRIEGPFTYQMVSDKGNYSIFLPEGNFTITASSSDESGRTIFLASDQIKVGTNDQRLDLVLKKASTLWDYSLPIAIILVLIAVFIWANRFWNHPSKNTERSASGTTDKIQTPGEPANEIQGTLPESPKKQVPLRPELDSDAKKVLSVLDSSEGRSTQKELRESLNFSDAKMSLILSELESSCYIKRFKRGRGNVIRKL